MGYLFSADYYYSYDSDGYDRNGYNRDGYDCNGHKRSYNDNDSSYSNSTAITDGLMLCSIMNLM